MNQMETIHQYGSPTFGPSVSFETGRYVVEPPMGMSHCVQEL